MKTGGIFGHKALGMAGGGVFGGKPVSGTGCSCGTGAVVPDDFGVDLFKPSLPVTDEIMNEATLLEKEVAMANAAQGTALGLSGTQIALILGGVAIGVWMLTKGKRVKANKRRRRAKRRMTASQEYRIGHGVKRPKRLGLGKKTRRVKANSKKTATTVIGAWLQGKAKKSNNTWTDGVSVFLFGNEIAKRTPSGSIRITTAGYPTTTTKDRLNAIPGVHVHTSKGRLFLHGQPWDGSWTTV